MYVGVLQGILYDEDVLGVRLTEKERQITELEEERRRLNQELSAAERELHAVQASMSVKDQEKTVSTATDWRHIVIVLPPLYPQYLERQLSRQQAELHRRETDISTLRVCSLWGLCRTANRPTYCTGTSRERSDTANRAQCSS